MNYVDGYILPVPKDKVEAYREIAEKSSALFKAWGALEVVECVADDVPYGEHTSFPRAVQATDDEIVVFSWITYPSREVRDEVMKKMADDPEMKAIMEDIPVDGRRMIFGGFVPIVRA